MLPQLLSGQRILVTFNGQNVGAGHVLDYSIATPHTVLRGVDTPRALELVPSGILINLSLRVYRLPQNDPVVLGFALPTDLAGGTDVNAKFTESRYLVIEIRDKQTDTTILYLPQSVIVQRSASVAAEDLMVETWSVLSIYASGPQSQTNGIIPVAKALF